MARLALITINACEKNMRACNSSERKTMFLILVHCLLWEVGLKVTGLLKEKEYSFWKLAGDIWYLM